ncbi:hypothetical protein GCM10023116_02370 [Kistimonas scapharcae]|uniref:Type II secretion system protein GspC N-terminal domain-containing protein n=1 Tax=Kistimonas scapharcae TaxID=1036133 RepID=A0ABP8UYQ8_9GAMM
MNNEVLDKSLNLLAKHQSSIILAVLTIGMLATLAVQSFNLYRTLQGPPEVSDIANDSNTSQKTFVLADFSFLFGEGQESNTQLSTQELPKTSLNLTLRGALAGDTTTDSSAIIQDGSGQDRFYRIGDSLPGGAVLDQVHPHYIVIRYHGALQKLVFPEITHDKVLETVSHPQTPPMPKEMPGLSDQYQENAKALEDRMEQLRQRLEQAQGN